MIAIEGNIGAGKSTLLEAIGTWFPSSSVVVPEPIGVWTRPLPGQDTSPLGKFYSDPEKNAMPFQVFVASSKVRDLREKLAAGNRGDAPGGAVFCERDPFDVDIFPRLNFEEGLFDEYQLSVMRHLVETLGATSGVPPVTATIYLRADPALCLERVTVRGRAEEGSGGVSIGKLRRIHSLHESKFVPGSGARVGSGSGSRDPAQVPVPVLVLDASAPVESHREAVRAFVTRITTDPARTSSGGSRDGSCSSARG